jgi:carboxymethylenebutenolidase
MSANIAAIERVWEAHTAAEFVSADVDATMATMTDEPVVLHVPTSIGARGRTAVRRFYGDHFIGHQARDMQLELVSRTATVDRVVDEMTISFTHDVEIPWVLPGVAPTGRRVVVPLVAVVGMRDGLIDSEHIYWDQASVLAQGWAPRPGRSAGNRGGTGQGLGRRRWAGPFNTLITESGSDVG